MKSITSADNPNFKRWLRLAESGREVRNRRQTLAEGTHLAETIHACAHPVEAVLVRHATQQDDVRRWAEHFVAVGAHGFELAGPLFDRLAPVEHGSGLLLQIAVPEARVLEGHDALFIDGVQDPGNAGALLRVAAAAGARNALAATGTVALWSPKVLRGAQGAHFRLHILEEVVPSRARTLLPMPWIGAVAHAGASLWSLDLSDRAVGFMFGSEGAGLSAAGTAVCDRLVTIPLANGIESLNVAAAAAVCMFERCRQVEASRARPLPRA